MIELKATIRSDVLRKLPLRIRSRLTNHPASIKGIKAAGQAYLSFLQQRFKARSEHATPPGGGEPWKDIGWVAALLRTRGVGSKFSTIEEIEQRASTTIKTLRNENTLFASLQAGRPGNILIANTGMLVTVGTSDSRAEALQEGQQSTWPAEDVLLAALEKRVKKKLPRKKKEQKLRVRRSKLGALKRALNRKSKAKPSKSKTLTKSKPLSKPKAPAKERIKAKPNWNPDFFKMKNTLKRIAGKTFGLPKRPIVEELTDRSQILVLGELMDRGYTKALRSL